MNMGHFKYTKMNDTDKIFNINYCYQYGTCVEKNEYKAFVYYQ